MPELPEVETMRRGLLPVVGGRITKIEIPDIPYRPIVIEPDIELFRKRSVRRHILSVERIAKRVLVKLDSGDAIVMQPKMAGIAMIGEPPSANHTRMIVHVHGAAADRFLYWDRRGLGTVSLWSVEQVHEKLGPHVLGPDASVVDEAVFIERFRNIQRTIKIAMLDQSIVAGIGNLYAAEILHAAKVSPLLRCCDISLSQWKRVHKHTLRILNEAIEYEGSTLRDGTYRNAINGEGQYQNQHQVYDREGERCYSCKKADVLRIVQGQRSTFYCPRCQA